MNGLIHTSGLLQGRFDRHLILMLIGGLLCVYFSYHLLHGQRSLGTLISTHSQIEAQSQVYADLKAERLALEKKVVMMRPGSVDRDLLEERIQTVLGYVAADDMIIPVK